MVPANAHVFNCISFDLSEKVAAVIETEFLTIIIIIIILFFW